MLASSPSDVIDFEVLDPDINFSDHMPLSLYIYIVDAVRREGFFYRTTRTLSAHSQLRWDRGDLFIIILTNF
jgi:hypothetical protein